MFPVLHLLLVCLANFRVRSQLLFPILVILNRHDLLRQGSMLIPSPPELVELETNRLIVVVEGEDAIRVSIARRFPALDVLSQKWNVVLRQHLAEV